MTAINIQHEETGRLQEWPADKPIPCGWVRVSEPFEPLSGHETDNDWIESAWQQYSQGNKPENS